MAILGLIGTEALSGQRFKNVRRSVFYDYPNGAAPLTGLTSLMEEESTNDPEYNHWEKRLKEQRTTTASQGSSKGPFLLADGTTDGGDPFATVAGTEYQVKVASSTEFRVGHLIRIPVSASSGTATKIVVGNITAITSATLIKFRATEAVTAIDNGTTNESVGVEVLVIGSAFAQGATGASQSVYHVPVNPENYAQIFRTAMQITGSALKTSLKYDETGAYKDKAKETAIDHMREIEFGFIFGRKTKYVDGTTNLPTYTTGGILYWMEQWEAGTFYEVTASTADTDDNKRIITNSAGTISEKQYDNYLERLFRVTNNKANEKLCLCGSGFLNTINRMYKSKSVLNADLPLTDTYGMKVVQHVSPFGTVFYKTHPLFTMNSTLRNNALFIDVGNLKYRYLDGRDTELLTNRQPNNADYREDEWLTEAGLECRYPESNLYLQNVLDFVA